MAWSDSLLEASFRGIDFDCLKTDDTADRATAEHAYPYLDGAHIEDLGRCARKVSIDAIFYGGDYEQRLKTFLRVLDESGEGDLQHPVFGAMFAQLTSYRIHHEADSVDQATVSLEFTESTPSQPFFDHSLPSQKAAAIATRGDTARDAFSAELANIIDTLRASDALASLDDLRQSMSGPLIAALSQVQGVLGSGLDVLTYPRAWANDISAVVDGILDLRDFGTSLMADWAATANVLGLFDVFTGSSSAAPAPMAAGTAPTEAQAVAVTQSYIATSAAIGRADATGLVLAAEAETPTLSPVEIEMVANAARSDIEAAIESVRAILPIEQSRPITEPLKDQALAIQEAARGIIEARPPLIQRAVEAPGNLRLLAHRWYGDHTRATELARLNLGNGLRQPNFIQSGDRLHAYAR